MIVEECGGGYSVVRQDYRNRPPCRVPYLQGRRRLEWVCQAVGGALRVVATSVIRAGESKPNLGPVYVPMCVLGNVGFRSTRAVVIQATER